MSTAEAEFTPSTAGKPESPAFLLAAAFGWWLLATFGVNFIVGIFIGLFSKTGGSLDPSSSSVSARTLYKDVLIMGACGVFFYAAQVHGRALNPPDINRGIGYQRVA